MVKIVRPECSRWEASWMLLQSKLCWSMGCRHLGTAQFFLYSPDFACLFDILVLPVIIMRVAFMKLQANVYI